MSIQHKIPYTCVRSVHPDHPMHKELDGTTFDDVAVVDVIPGAFCHTAVVSFASGEMQVIIAVGWGHSYSYRIIMNCADSAPTVGNSADYLSYTQCVARLSADLALILNKGFAPKIEELLKVIGVC